MQNHRNSGRYGSQTILVDPKSKAYLRNRSYPLTEKQASQCRKMGLTTTKGITEKQAVSIIKHTVTGATNFKGSNSTNLIQRRPTPKPKRITKRAYLLNQLMYSALALNSNRAKKRLKLEFNRELTPADYELYKLSTPVKVKLT